jgi:GNAT superfamily N-acetyltransferase
MNLGDRYRGYLLEKFNMHVFESDHGFIAYRLYGDKFVEIDILFIDKDCRKQGEGTAIWEEFKKTLPENVSVCTAEIDTLSNGPEGALVAFIKRGFKILNLEGSKIRIYNNFRGEEKCCH